MFPIFSRQPFSRCLTIHLVIHRTLVSLFLFPFLFFFFMSVSFVSSFHQVSFVPIIDHTFIFLRLFVFKRIAICRKYILELSRINTFISSPSIFSYVSRISISARYIEAEISSHKPLLSLSLLVCPSIKVTRWIYGRSRCRYRKLHCSGENNSLAREFRSVSRRESRPNGRFACRLENGCTSETH